MKRQYAGVLIKIAALRGCEVSSLGIAIAFGFVQSLCGLSLVFSSNHPLGLFVLLPLLAPPQGGNKRRSGFKLQAERVSAVRELASF